MPLDAQNSSLTAGVGVKYEAELVAECLAHFFDFEQRSSLGSWRRLNILPVVARPGGRVTRQDVVFYGH